MKLSSLSVSFSHHELTSTAFYCNRRENKRLRLIQPYNRLVTGLIMHYIWEEARVL